MALGLPTAQQLSRAVEGEYKDGTTFFEFRLDYLSHPETAVELITDLNARQPNIAILATCRHKQHNGFYSGPVETQIALLRDAAKAGAMAADLEVESAECAKPALPSIREHGALIISYHNFANTPALEPALRRLRRIPADAYKIATTAKKPSDNIRLLQLVRDHRDVPLIAFTMSEVGTVTRILTPSLGAAFTYACSSECDGTAPGQIRARLMRSLYRADKLTKDTRVYGIIADPVAHSKSPLIHNRAFQARRCDAVYVPFLVSSVNLGDWMKLANALPVCGFSVTIPHKQRIMRYLDTVEPLAKRIGAVNTVWRKAGRWRGTNTDVQGLMNPLSRHLRLAHASVLIAGYGGAARAAAVALADAGAKLTITGRNMQTAQQLARAVKAETASLQTAQHSHFDALVHATPVGMYPNVNEVLFENVPAEVVLDMVYNPQETLLLKRAKEQGRTVIYGSEMLIDQAAHQFEIWTGESAPRGVMQAALEQSW